MRQTALNRIWQHHRNMKRFLFFSVSVLALLLFTASDSFACSCSLIQLIPEGSSEKPRNYTEPIGNFVFSGTVLTVKRNILSVDVTFRVNKVWKGKVSQIMTIITGNGNGDCGYSFEKGKSYLVDADKNNKQIYTNICTKTERLIEAKETLEFLGKGKSPRNKRQSSKL